jgi:phosphatidylglycerol:prolipoprotein diacylglycerol transferase
MYIDGNYRQPLFLWEMLINLCGFLLLFIVCDIPKKFRKAGDLAILYFL